MAHGAHLGAAALRDAARNPYLESKPLHYYWTYFLVPAAITGAGPKAVRNIDDALKTNAIATAFVLAASLYAFAATAVRRRMAAALAVALVILASSAEGLALIVNQLGGGGSLSILRGVNVDAVTAWWYDGLRIDGVHRTMFYTPQHGMSCAFGVLALLVPSIAGAAVPPAGATLAGLLLGLSTAFNPFLGAAFCAVYGAAVLLDLVVNRRPLTGLPVHALAALPPLLAVGWSIANAMGDGAGAALTIGWVGYARNAPVRTLLLSAGPVLFPAIAGFWPDRRLPAQPARAAAAALVVSLTLLYFVMLSDKSWVGFRAGQLLLAALTVPLARLLDRMLNAGRTRLATGIVCGVLLLGVPTTAVDVYNAADITNTAMGPGFPWTVVLSREQRDGLLWIQRFTPANAVVQAEPFVRGRTEWSLIPSFAERRMAAGLPISLLSTPDYAAGARKVQSILRARSANDRAPDRAAAGHSVSVGGSATIGVSTVLASPCSTPRRRSSRRVFQRGRGRRLRGEVTRVGFVFGFGFVIRVRRDRRIRTRTRKRQRLRRRRSYPFLYRQKVRAPMNQSRKPIFLPSALLRG